MTHHEVIIVGAGPVGLGAALELARFGVRSVLLEKHSGITTHPKARNFNTRTMEIARGWGEVVYKRLRAIDTPEGWKTPIRFLESATGREFGQIETLGFVGPGPDVSPAKPIMSSQDLLEAVLLDAVRATGLVDVRFGHEVIGLLRGGGPEHVDAAVEVRSADTNETQVLVGRTIIAADGAGSFVRNALDIPLEGDAGLSHLINCYFKADIERHIEDRKGVIFFISNANARGVLQPLDAAGRWLCQIQVKAQDWTLDTFKPDVAKTWIRAATGLADLEPEILSLGLWKLNATVAERLVQGRIVLCGDAAHQFPPTGGLGVNTGLQGMHNVIWKLAYFVEGLAGWPLVESYNTERRGISRRIADQSLENSANVGRIQAAAISGRSSTLSVEDALTTSRRYGNHLGVEFGATYDSIATVSDGTGPPPVADNYSEYVPSATPGRRAPHAWLGGPEAGLSVLDLFGAGFTLLHRANGARWPAKAADVSTRLGVSIDSYAIGGAGLSGWSEFSRLYELSNDGAVLVRPDGHIAWRAALGDPGEVSLETALHQILARSPG